MMVYFDKVPVNQEGVLAVLLLAVVLADPALELLGADSDKLERLDKAFKDDRLLIY